MSTEIRLVWKVTHQHIETFTPETFAAWIEAAQIDVDPTNLDAVYEELDSHGWRAAEALLELASDRNWVDSDPDEAQVSDLIERDTEAPA